MPNAKDWEVTRSHFRLVYQSPIRYRFAKKITKGKYNVSKFHNGIGVNFSGGGLGFYAGKPLPMGTLVLVEMLFPFCQELILATSHVVFREEQLYKGSKVSFIGVKFIHINEVQRDQMVKFFISGGKAF